MFDVFIDSSEVGMRKPERGIYELAIKLSAEKLGLNSGGLSPQEFVMVDDLGM